MKKLLKFIYSHLSPSFKIKIDYYRSFGKWPNIRNPRNFNEKVLRRIIYDRNEIYPVLTDKYLVREFIEQLIGSNVLIPLIAFTKNPKELLEIYDWSDCVLKPNHGAGMVQLFNKNPSLQAKRDLIGLSEEWLKTDYSKICNEWHYSQIKPILLLEKKITKNNEIPRDYKFHCFRQDDNSIKYVLQLVDGRFGEESRGYYLDSLENCVWSHGIGKHTLDISEKNYLKNMIEYNSKIINAININYLRIDWYLVESEIYFGELTFTPGAGRSNEFGEALEKTMACYWKD